MTRFQRDLLSFLLGVLITLSAFGVREILSQMAYQNYRLERIESFLSAVNQSHQ